MIISLMQTDILWENREDNLEKYNRLLAQNNSPSDLVVLPEMFTTGFSMNPEKLYESKDCSSVKWLQEKACEYQTAIAGSLIIKEQDNFYNRFVFAGKNKELHFYNKRHMFRMGGENEKYVPGNKRLVFSYNGWRICPLICYDLRFPVWSRNRDDYDLLIYVANWPAARAEVWNILLKARAIENQAYVIGVNRTGKDGEGILYQGQSQVVNPKGELILKLEDKEQCAQCFLDLEKLNHFKKKFPVWKDRDHFISDW